jgi:Tol biopolymer transport system component
MCMSVVVGGLAAPAVAAGPAAPGALLVRERPPCTLTFALPSGGVPHCESTRPDKLVIRSPSGRALRSYRVGHYVYAATMSPDGRWIAMLSDKGRSTGLLLVRVSNGKRRWLVRPVGHLGGAPAWTPDSTKVLYGLRGDPWVIDVRTGATARVPLPSLSNEHTFHLFLPNGDVLYAGRPDPIHVLANPYQFFRVPLSGAPATPITAEFEQNPEPADVAPDGQAVAFLADSKVWVVPVGGEPHAIADGPTGLEPGAIKWSPDGTRLAVRWNVRPPVGRFVTPRSHSELVGLDGSRTPLSVDLGPYADRFTWSPDSRYVAYDGKARKPSKSGYDTNVVVVSTTGRVYRVGFPHSADAPQWVPWKRGR